MNSLKLIAAVCGVSLVGGAIALVVTNPDQSAYEAYAVSQLQAQLTKGVCEDAPSLLRGVCDSAIEKNDQLLTTVVQSSTTRHNYYLLSIYETDLDPVNALAQLLPGNLALSIGESKGIPAYHVETVGIMGRFFTYETKKQN